MHIRKQDRPRKALITHFGTYEYIRMYFGPTNAPAPFQRVFDVIRTKYKWETCLAHLDDMIIYSKTTEDHIGHVDVLLTDLQHACITLRKKEIQTFYDRSQIFRVHH